MPRFVEVHHAEWVAAPEARVRGQFADLQHHIDARVHRKLDLRILRHGADGRVDRYEQRVRLLGIAQRDVFERSYAADGGIVDTSVEGFNRGGSLTIAFAPERRGEVEGTCVHVTARIPLPPLVGALLRPLLEVQLRKEVIAAAAEDKHDIESGAFRWRGPSTLPAPGMAGAPDVAMTRAAGG